MRILIANEALRGGGGVETYLATLVPALQAAGHAVGVLHDNPEKEPGPECIAPGGIWRLGVQDAGGVDAAMRAVDQFAPDVCFSHNMRSLDIDRRLAAGWPLVKMMHGHFGTCVSGQKAFAFPSRVACTRTFGPGCLAHYLPRRCGEVNPAVMLRRYRWGLEQRSLFSVYRGIVVASRFMRDEYVRAGADADTVHAIPLFAPPPLGPGPAATWPRPVDLLFLGRLTALKGPDLAIGAAAHASGRLGRPVSVVLAGEGPLRGRLADLAAVQGVKATFPGWVTAAARDELLRDSAVLVVPSRWPEPFGLVGLEGAAFGTPAVAFDTGGVRDWLRDGLNGRLVDPGGGADGLGTAVAEVLSQPDLHARLSAGARQQAAAFTIEAHLTALLPVLARAAAIPVRAA